MERKNLSQSSFAYLGQDLFFHKYKSIKDACTVCCFTDNGHNVDHFHQGSLLSMCVYRQLVIGSATGLEPPLNFDEHAVVVFKTPGMKVIIPMVTRQASAN